jgi:hypothetical protein
MTAKVIYTTMAMEFPSWAYKAMTKFQKGFLWRGRKEANVGHCLLAWLKVTLPKELGDLEIHDLQSLS